jgi:hypothetical protein
MLLPLLLLVDLGLKGVLLVFPRLERCSISQAVSFLSRMVLFLMSRLRVLFLGSGMRRLVTLVDGFVVVD